MKIKTLIISLLLILTFQFAIAQNEHEDAHHDFKHFRVAALIGHAFSPEANTDTSSFLLIPTYGLDIQYWFNHKWGIALKNDLEIAEYSVEDSSKNIERQFPFIMALPVLFSPWERSHFTFIAGPGIEIESHKNFSVMRLGVGSEFEIGNHWDFSPEIIYDLKNGHINTLTLALGVGKRF